MSTDEHVIPDTQDPGAARDALLMARLKRLITDEGIVGAAETLGVNYRTLTGCIDAGRLSRRVREAVRKLPEEGVEDEPQPAAGVEQRVAEVEQAIEGLRQAVGEVTGAERPYSCAIRVLRSGGGPRPNRRLAPCSCI